MSGGVRPTAGSVALGLGGVAVVVVVVDAVNAAVGGSALVGLGLLVLAGVAGGRLMALLGLPRLTGYLLAGIALGPEAAGLLSTADTKSLSLVNALALALIALQAGTELTLATLVRTWKSVLASAAAQAVVVVVPVAAAFYAAKDAIPFVAPLPLQGAIALALLWGVMALTRSPAVTLAVLSETRAKGPVADYALGVVVVLDVLVLPLFAVALAVARAAGGGEPFGIAALEELGFELFASVCMGATLGLGLLLVLRVVRHERLIVVVVVGYAVTALSTFLHYDTLLVFVVSGFVVANLPALFGVDGDTSGPELTHSLEQVGAGVMVVFFATAGAKLDLSALKTLWPLALGFALVRAVFTVVACRMGHWIARDPPVVTRLGFTSLISQAGVTIGLATIIADRLPGLGKELATLVIAVVGINELIGPVVFSWGLRRAGELPATPVTST
jgi:Kef-type K+ transport system membrane component KefB